MPDEISIDDWYRLNDQLLAAGRKVVAHLGAPDQKRLPPNAILAGFTRKAVKTLEGIQLLAKNDAWEEAQVLTRVVFELRVTFDCFWDMLMSDPGVACRRVFDAMMLEKMKQIRSYPDEQFQRGVNRPSWDTVIAEISGRYTPSELAALKKHGFTGQSVEQRSLKAGYSHVYQIMYRNLSRNVHATDFVEQLGEITFDNAYMSGYRQTRNHTVLFIGNWSAGGVILRADIDKLCRSELPALYARQRELTSVFGPLCGPNGTDV